jgi:co-chaperonin GroES (HSP10)
MASVSLHPAVRVKKRVLVEAFPDVDPGMRPLGSRVLVQIRSIPDNLVTEGGIIIPDHDTKDAEKWNCQVAKVVAIGPVAFRNRSTLEPWPEGAWTKVGQYVRVPKYGGDRWERPVPNRPKDPALFAMFNDLDLIGIVEGDPLDIRTFV